MSWLDDLFSQMTAQTDTGGQAADAVPSEAATTSDFNPAKDSQSASDLFSAIAAVDHSNPSTDMPTESPSFLQAMGAGQQGQPADARNGSDVMSDQFDATNQNPSAAGGFANFAQKVAKSDIKRNADGSIDWGDPNNIQMFTKLLTGVTGVASALYHGNRPTGYKSAQDLQNEIKSLNSSWTPQQQTWANGFFNHQQVAPAQRQRLYAADMPSPIVPGKGYAAGGPVGALGHVVASSGGQDDVVPAQMTHGQPVRLAGGEYVMDADTVAAAGDGNNAAGAKKFDALRQNLRTHKRSAPPSKIPPRAKSLKTYMNGGQ